ncbi:DUF5947 family protein [Streptomyces sp. NPDC003077]|uniref:DUF5947 family protein n=1 Tax=Streptomyces sp. NPDC003077 TaxID=3154443 RepID=UPI0033BD98FD
MTAGAGLRRFRDSGPVRPPQARCELCSAALEPFHGHVVDLDDRGLLCACRPCRLLLIRPGGSAGRYRGVPDRPRDARDFVLSAEQWEALRLPVAMAFCFRNSRLGRYVAFYPSPAGATESLLPEDAWRRVLAANPAVADLADDVEALLLRRRDGGAGVECHLVPIDACYDLVGRLRLHWRGFDGGARVRREMDAFFAELRGRRTGGDGRSRPAPEAGDGGPAVLTPSALRARAAAASPGPAPAPEGRGTGPGVSVPGPRRGSADEPVVPGRPVRNGDPSPERSDGE